MLFNAPWWYSVSWPIFIEHNKVQTYSFQPGIVQGKSGLKVKAREDDSVLGSSDGRGAYQC